MARKRQRLAATRHVPLVPQRSSCENCGGTLWLAYRSVRTITTLDDVCQLLLTVRRCHNPECPRYHSPYRPEEEGRWALPHGEFGLDIIALIRTLRYNMHRSVPDCLSGEILLARSLLSASETDLAALIQEVQQSLPVPIHGVVSDGQHSIRNAVHSTLPDVPHQLCHFHYLREAAKPVYEADRHAKKELKKHIRGGRPIERAAENQNDAEAEAIRGYCLAVRGALTDDGRPPLEAPGLKLHERIAAIATSLTRVSEKGACRVS
jgi:hypothetical protein